MALVSHESARLSSSLSVISLMALPRENGARELAIVAGGFTQTFAEVYSWIKRRQSSGLGPIHILTFSRLCSLQIPFKTSA